MLAVRDRILVRKFERVDEMVWQIVLPKSIRVDFLGQMQAGVGGSHLGWHW